MDLIVKQPEKKVLKLNRTGEVDPTVPQHVKDITEENIEDWNKVIGLEMILQNILEAIQEGGTTSNTIAEIEKLIVSYFEARTAREVEE